jgi:hypothetical protein
MAFATRSVENRSMSLVTMKLNEAFAMFRDIIREASG